ncbi:MAG: C4-dicarboxylate ABC transporter, partial [Gammaproteobacteria bacterium CG22_combo_CG10-13_8_21_14_all_40_8]
QSQQEVDFVKQHLDPLIQKGMEKSGFVTFGYAGGGFAYLMSKQPITSLADIDQRKVWIPSGDDVAKAVVNAFNITPIPLSLGDVLPALQTGIIDTVTISPIGALAFQWQTQVKYITEMPVLYLYATLAIDIKAFTSISEADQKSVRDVFGKVFQEIDEENKKNDAEALQALRNLGIEFVKPSAAEMALWTEKARTVAPLMVKNQTLSQQIFDRANEWLKQYRSK